MRRCLPGCLVGLHLSSERLQGRFPRGSLRGDVESQLQCKPSEGRLSELLENREVRSNNLMAKTDDTTYLRWHVTQLVRVWTALSMIRQIHDNETIAVFQDACSDVLR